MFKLFFVIFFTLSAAQLIVIDNGHQHSYFGSELFHDCGNKSSISLYTFCGVFQANGRCKDLSWHGFTLSRIAWNFNLYILQVCFHSTKAWCSELYLRFHRSLDLTIHYARRHDMCLFSLPGYFFIHSYGYQAKIYGIYQELAYFHNNSYHFVASGNSGDDFNCVYDPIVCHPHSIGVTLDYQGGNSFQQPCPCLLSKLSITNDMLYKLSSSSIIRGSSFAPPIFAILAKICNLSQLDFIRVMLTMSRNFDSKIDFSFVDRMFALCDSRVIHTYPKLACGESHNCTSLFDLVQYSFCLDKGTITINLGHETINFSKLSSGCYSGNLKLYSNFNTSFPYKLSYTGYGYYDQTFSCQTILDCFD